MNRPKAGCLGPYNPPPMPKTRARPSLVDSLVLLVGLAAAAASGPTQAQMTVEITEPPVRLKAKAAGMQCLGVLGTLAPAP